MFKDENINFKEIQDEIYRLLKEKIISPEEIEKMLSDSYIEALHQTSKETYSHLRSQVPEMVEENNKIRTGFEARLNETWSKPLNSLEAFSMISNELGANFLKENFDEAHKNNNNTFFILTRLHAQASSRWFC